MGTKDGSIIATIITTHMPRNDAAAPGHVCRGIRIHAIDIVQPPGIGISPIADMDAHQTIVTAALIAKSSAETPKKACWVARSEDMRREISNPAVAPRQPRLRSAVVVLVVAAPPGGRLVAPLGCAVEPLEHAPEAVHPARRLYACSFARGACDTAESVTSWLARWTTKPSNPSAIAEQDGHPAV